MVRWLSQGVDPSAQAAAVRAQFPVSEVKLAAPESPDGWDDLAEPLADVIGRGDIPTELDSAKLAIMNLKNRAANKFGPLMTKVAKMGALEALIKRIETPVSCSVPPQSIWWREVTSVLDLVAAVRPFRASILKAMKFLLTSSHFQHIYSIRCIAVEIIISLVILAPDFDTFVALRQEGLFQVLCDLLSSLSADHAEKSEWVVYDLGSQENPLCVQSICINIFAYAMSECNVASRSKSANPEAKSLLAELENFPVFIKAIDAIREHKDSASPKYIADSIRHLTMLFVFGGRSQCVQRENLNWVDDAALFLSEVPKIVAASFELPDDGTKAFTEKVQLECDFLIALIRERHEPSRTMNRSRLPDLRQKFRNVADNTNRSIASPEMSPGSIAETASQKPSCRTCGADSGLKKCQRCLSVLYCSRQCQVSDWKQHKVSCNKR